MIWGAGAHGIERVGQRETAIVVAVDRDHRRELTGFELGFESEYVVVQVGRSAGYHQPGGVGDADDVGAGFDRRNRRGNNITEFRANGILRRVAHEQVRLLLLGVRDDARDLLHGFLEPLLKDSREAAVRDAVEDPEHANAAVECHIDIVT